MCFAPQRRALFRDLNFQKWSEPLVSLTFWLPNVLRATTACTFSRSELPKVVREWCALYILTSKCASRHNGVHFFDIATSKSGPTMVCFVHFDLKMCFAPQRRALFRDLNFQKWSDLEMCFAPQRRALFRDLNFQKWSENGVFVHFDLEMCFAPQRRALFRHRNFQKWSDHGVFCTFWLENVLRATTACTFSTSQLPKVVRPWCVLYILTAGSAPAALASLLFDPPEPQIIGKTKWIATFLPFRASYSFSSTLISSNLSLLSASSLLCFSSVHIVGSLTSKLPSIILSWDILYIIHRLSQIINLFKASPTGPHLFHLFHQRLIRRPGVHRVGIRPAQVPPTLGSMWSSNGDFMGFIGFHRDFQGILDEISWEVHGKYNLPAR